MERAIVLVSGGIDSAVTLWFALRQGWEVHALSFDYHLRPRQEEAATRRLLTVAGVTSHTRLPLPFMKELEDLRSEGLPLEQLADAPSAYVPARNMVFYSLAAHRAEIQGARWIVGGHNADDLGAYPDTSPEFFAAFRQFCRLGVRSYARRPIDVLLPLARLNKVEVLRLGQELGAPLELTWSCYWDGETPCGRCPSCLERTAAFREVGGPAA